MFKHSFLSLKDSRRQDLQIPSNTNMIGWAKSGKMVCRTTRVKFIAALFFISILIILIISVYENISALCCVQMNAEF